MAKNKKISKMRAWSKAVSVQTLFILILVIIFVLSSVWGFISYSSNRTERAVQSISRFYLEELSNNVSNVFESHFDGYYKELKLALLATKEAVFTNHDDVVRHMQNMAERGEFMFYALLDEDGNVYISHPEHRSDFLVDFLTNCDFEDNIDEKAALEYHEDRENVLIIALPAQEGTAIGNTKIVAGAKGIAANRGREEIMLRHEGNRTIAHMMTTDGTYVIAGDNPAVVKSDNYFDDLKNSVQFMEGFSLERMLTDIQQGKSGSTVYYIGDEIHYSYYSHLPRSGWVLVVTMPYNVISGMVESISFGLMSGGVLLAVAICSIMAVVFYSYYRQRKLSMDMNLKRAEAEERNRAKSSFLSSMSHDIRTPMNAIIGFTNLAMQQDNNPRVSDYLMKIQTASSHLLSLINDVLDMSRIESGKMHLDESKCNLAEIFHALNSIIQGQVHAKQQYLCVDVLNVVNENVWCDKMRLNQLMLNLLSNAVKFTPAGGTISVMIIQKECNRPGYGAYEFRVKDTGIGMSKEFSKKIFEPFERERTETVNGIQGTGLGMSIAKNITDMMGGTIRVETEQNKGTEFIINVEFRLQDEADRARALSVNDLKGMRAIVVDDDFAACDSIIKMLFKLGMEADWTMSGREAVLRIKQSTELEKKYDVLIIDWQLPDLNGLEVIRQVKASAEYDLPVLLMTSYSWDDVEEEAIKAGVSRFCNKPIFMSDLRTLLLEMVSQSESFTKAEKADEGVAEFKGKRILLAEDNELNREIALEVLKSHGFEVDVAENGAIAVEKVEKSKPGYYDVVLMDVQMPIMDGHEATRAIRALSDPGLALLPILTMTANAFEEDVRNSLAAGMNDHITKPLDMDNLFEILRRNL